MRIAVIGYSGSGKSTAAKQLSEFYASPLLHIDTLNFLPGWIQRDRALVHADVGDFIERNQSWVIDGNYSCHFFKERMELADIIVFFDFSRMACLKNAVVRRIKYRNKVRPSAAPGCAEKLDLEFLSWLLIGGRTKEVRGRYRQVAAQYSEKVFILKNRRQADAFIARQRAVTRGQ